MVDLSMSLLPRLADGRAGGVIFVVNTQFVRAHPLTCVHGQLCDPPGYSVRIRNHFA